MEGFEHKVTHLSFLYLAGNFSKKVNPLLFVFSLPTSTALGEPGGWGGGRAQWCAEWAPGPQLRLPLSGPATTEPGPDAGQCHQWDHEHRASLHQAPQGHLWGSHGGACGGMCGGIQTLLGRADSVHRLTFSSPKALEKAAALTSQIVFNWMKVHPLGFPFLFLSYVSSIFANNSLICTLCPVILYLPVCLFFVSVLSFYEPLLLVSWFLIQQRPNLPHSLKQI